MCHSVGRHIHLNEDFPPQEPDSAPSNTDTRKYRIDFGSDTRPYRNQLDTDAWLSQNGIGQATGRRPAARHRKPPSRRMRQAATATAVVLAGGGAAVGLLYATGPQPALGGAADQTAHTVTSATRPGGAEGATTALATPAAASSPVNAYVPGTRPRAGGTPP